MLVLIGEKGGVTYSNLMVLSKSSSISRIKSKKEKYICGTVYAILQVSVSGLSASETIPSSDRLWCQKCEVRHTHECMRLIMRLQVKEREKERERERERKVNVNR